MVAPSLCHKSSSHCQQPGNSSTQSPCHITAGTNDKAKLAVKNEKRLFKGSPDSYLALLGWRNTPTMEFNASPFQHLLARQTRRIVPNSQVKLAVEPPPADMWE